MRTHDPFRRFVRLIRAALSGPVADEPELANVTRRRVIVGVTVLLGSVITYWSFHIPAGDAQFYPATLCLAAVWVIGAFLSGPIAVAALRPQPQRQLVMSYWFSLILGAVLLLLFLLGALIVAHVPMLLGPVQQLLDYARLGSLGAIAVITIVNGISEEYFFRGAVFQALPPRWRIFGSTAIYTTVTALSGVPLLALAGAALGLLVAVQRRITGSFVPGVITHLVWSVGMLFLLPPILDMAVPNLE